MSKGIHRLTALGVSRLTKPGLHADGGGLYLQVTSKTARSWVFRYSAGGQDHRLGLGPASAVPLADARARAAELRAQRWAGTDPMAERTRKKREAAIEAAKAMSFKECAEKFIESHKAGWRNAKHAAQWTATLETYAYPVIGRLPVSAVDTTLVLKVLLPIWTAKNETASRVRGRIEAILGWAASVGLRDGPNPARWKDHLSHSLPARSKVAQVEHHAALPYDEIGDFIVDLRRREAVAARALEFTILTAARTGEVIGATWMEFDFAAKTWTIPANRMKGNREHRVPLSTAAIDILNAMRKLAPIKDGSPDPGAPIFPGGRPGKPLSNMALLILLRRMKRGDLTAHGFRSTFRQWAADRTSFPPEAAEAALAHIEHDKTVAAYQRSDLFAKRQKMMDAWSRFCATPQRSANNVTEFPGAPAARAAGAA